MPRSRPCRTPTAAAEALEPRALLSFGPAGAEFRVNTATDGDQRWPAAAANAAGDFVVAWESRDQDGSFRGVYAQRLDATGSARGDEFRVNTFTRNDQYEPAVAVDAAGGFVLAWSSINQGGGFTNADVYARRFDADGNPLGGEFLVNTTVAGDERIPTVAIAPGGDFLIAWQATLSPNGGIFARRYNAAGVPQTDEFRVNSTTAAIPRARPVAAADAGGGFIVAWDSFGQDEANGYGVYARRFDPAGSPRGDEFLVNVTTAGSQADPRVAALADGGFVVTWLHDPPPNGGNDFDVYARRYDAAGQPLGGEFLVNATTAGNQYEPQVAADAGGFLITWVSIGQDGSQSGVYARRYDAAAVAKGDEFRVNSTTAGDQAEPAVAADAAGNFLVAWQSPGQDGGGYGVYARRVADAPSVVAVYADSTSWTGAFRGGLEDSGLGSATLGYRLPTGDADQLTALSWNNVDRIRVTFSRDVSIQQDDLSLRGVNVPNYAFADGTAAGFGYDADTFTATWTLAERVAADKLLLDLDGDAPDGVTAAAVAGGAPTGILLDGEWSDGTSTFPSGDRTAGGDFRFRLNTLPGDVNRNGGVVNSQDVQLTRLRQFTSPGDPGTPPNTYTAFHDVDGSAFINSIDVQQVRIRQFSRLPDEVPTLMTPVSGRAPKARPVVAVFGIVTIAPPRGPDEGEAVLP